MHWPQRWPPQVPQPPEGAPDHLQLRHDVLEGVAAWHVSHTLICGFAACKAPLEVSASHVYLFTLHLLPSMLIPFLLGKIA